MEPTEIGRQQDTEGGTAMDVLLVSAVPVTTFLDLLLKPIWGAWLMLAVLVVFVLRERASIGRAVMRSCTALGLITVVLLPTLHAPTLALEQGIRIGGLIGSLLIAVNLLSRSVGRHRRAREVLNRVYFLPPERRYLGLSIASQFFAGLLGLAGVVMMMEAASAQESGEEQRMAHFSAVTRGYAGVSLWSPMYSNMGIVLSLSGGTTWTQVLPIAVLISGLFIVLGALLDSLQRYKRSPGAGAKAHQIWRAGWPVALGMIGFLTVIVIASHRAHLAVPAVIIASAPLVAMLFNYSQRSGEVGRIKAVLHQMATDALTFKQMSGEALLFLVSGCAGTVIGVAIPLSWTTALGAMVSGTPVAGTLLASTAIVAISSFSVHPMLSSVIVSTCLPPPLIGLPPMIHVAALLVGWGLAIIVTPFSVTSVLASRWSGLSLWRVSVGTNATFVALALVTSSTVLGLIALRG